MTQTDDPSVCVLARQMWGFQFDVMMSNRNSSHRKTQQTFSLLIQCTSLMAQKITGLHCLCWSIFRRGFGHWMLVFLVVPVIRLLRCHFSLPAGHFKTHFDPHSHIAVFINACFVVLKREFVTNENYLFIRNHFSNTFCSSQRRWFGECLWCLLFIQWNWQRSNIN